MRQFSSMEPQVGPENTQQKVLLSPEKINTILLIVIVILLLVIIGGAIYIVRNIQNNNQSLTPAPPPGPITPTFLVPDESSTATAIPQANPATVTTISFAPKSGWSTYESELGFSFQYPPEFASPHKNPIIYKSDEPAYCGFYAYTRKSNTQFQDNIEIKVLPYSGGSRRQMLSERLSIPTENLQNIQETEVSGIRGLTAQYDIKLPNINHKVFAGIFIQNNTAFIISNLQTTPNASFWIAVLETLQIDKTLYVDTAKCQNDW